MSQFLKSIVDSKWFSPFIISMIVVAGVVIGMETYPDFHQRHKALLTGIDNFVLLIFVLEAIIKMGAHGRHFYRYFKDSWNVFDFVIVVICLLPIEANEFAAIFRLARILRVFKLITALPKLQVIVGALLKSIPGMGYVFMLLLIQFYMYAALGTFLFGQNDPLHFGNLETSMLTLFRVVTLEGWTEVMYINIYGSDWYGYDSGADALVADMGLPRVSQSMPLTSSAYFVSFVLFGAMMMLNLFIGVIMAGMEEMRQENEMEAWAMSEEAKATTLQDEINKLNHKLQELTEGIDLLATRIRITEREHEQELKALREKH